MDVLYSLNAKVVDVDTGSNRICAVQFVTLQHKLLLINVYMPFEDTHIDTDEYSFQLAIISDLMDKYPDSHVIFGGDCNVDFSRD